MLMHDARMLLGVPSQKFGAGLRALFSPGLKLDSSPANGTHIYWFSQSQMIWIIFD
jgi:hypothetical protein